MDNSRETSWMEVLSDRQIITRFRKLFGREMTAKERQIFFLPNDAPSGRGENNQFSREDKLPSAPASR
jgi:hypothetical protein